MASLDVGLECGGQTKTGGSVGSLMAWKHQNIESGNHFLVSGCSEVNRVHFNLSHILLIEFAFSYLCVMSLILLISFLKICSINPHAPQFSCCGIIAISDTYSSPMKSAVCLIFSANVIFYESCDKSS